MTLRIGVDIDNVLFQFDEATRLDVCEPRLGHELPRATVWDFYTEEWGIDRATFWQWCNESHAAGGLFWSGHAIEGARDALVELVDAGHTIHLCTARSWSHAATVAWLAAEAMPYDSLTFSSDKTVVDVDLFVDDNADNWQQVYDRCKARSLLFDQPWNRHVTAGLNDGLRVRTWDDIVAKVHWLNVWASR